MMVLGVQMSGMMRSGGEAAQCGWKRAASREEEPLHLVLALRFYRPPQTNEHAAAQYVARVPRGYLRVFDFRPLKRQHPDWRVGRRNAAFSS